MSLLPGRDVISTPETGFARATVDDGPREVSVAMLVGRDAVALAEAENAGHVCGVDQIVHNASFGHDRVSLLVTTAPIGDLSHLSCQVSRVQYPTRERSGDP